MNLTAPPGTKRPRKRGRLNKDSPDGLPLPPKKRGRPRKILEAPAASDVVASSANQDDEEEEDFGLGEEDGNGGDGGDVSEEDYESEEDMVQPIHPLDRRRSLVGLTEYGSGASYQPFTLPSFSSLGDKSEIYLDRMQSELASLRRQSSEAVSVSLRLSEQLAQAQADASRTRADLRTVEIMLEEEGRQRRKAERALDDEVRRRHTAEEALSTMLMQTSHASGSSLRP